MALPDPLMDPDIHTPTSQNGAILPYVAGTTVARSFMACAARSYPHPVWLPASAGRLREAIHRLATAIAFRLKPEATPLLLGFLFDVLVHTSQRNASAGLMRLARQAGAAAAAIAVSTRTTGTVMNVSGSSGSTPKRKVATSRPESAARTMPATTPVAIIQPASRNTSHVTRRLVAPSAMRTPISRCRCCTV